MPEEKQRMKMFYEIPTVNLSAEETIDRMRIAELVEYERYCADYRHKEQQRQLWFEDGNIVTTWFSGLFVDYIKASPTKNVPAAQGACEDEKVSHMVHHRVNDTVVWLKGDRAVAELLCLLCFRTKIGWEWMDIQCWCRMHYRVERREGKWGIVYFEGIYEKDRMDPVFQDSVLKIPREKLMQYRPINWNMALRRDVFEGGGAGFDAWAGADRPETVERLYLESSRWLNLE